MKFPEIHKALLEGENPEKAISDLIDRKLAENNDIWFEWIIIFAIIIVIFGGWVSTKIN